MKTFVQFGAGNIGRSFIARLFASAGYAPVFVDVDPTLIALLNARGAYPVVVKKNDGPDETLLVEGVRAIDGRKKEAVLEALLSADAAATSVGQRGLLSVFPSLAAALVARKAQGRPPLDLIIAENIRSGAAFFRQHLTPLLPLGFPLDQHLGLVETSIGKMVPIMPPAALAADPLQLFAEPYDTLIADRQGFLQALPPLAGLKAVDNIAAWVDRKLFLHSLSHASLAYFAYQADPTLVYVWQAMQVPVVVAAVRAALQQSMAALLRAYPNDLNADELSEHADDLLQRYQNRALGDTLHRVGRDLARKLSHDDRLIGACLLAARYALPFDQIVPAVRAALKFAAPDEQGRVADVEILQAAAQNSRQTLFDLAKLDLANPLERQVLDACFAA